MCGFVGIITKDEVNEAKIDSALDSIKHRGPDHKEYVQESVNGTLVMLGHTRLSIIDLTDAGSQPFHSDCGSYSLIFNGEIYNYKELRSELELLGIVFKTQTDTEVLLKSITQWGLDVLPRLIGMFSFVYFDRHQNNLTLVRDAFGIKPFFYCNENNNFTFASELGPLLKLRDCNSKPNLQAAYDYLVHGDYDSTETSFIDGVKHLRPAHYLVFDIASQSIKEISPWWKPNIQTRTDISFEEAVCQLRKLFLESIQLHLRSDVPLGIALSGGIDSSAVVSAVRFLEPDIELNTFSYIASDALISEEHWVDKLNAGMNAIQHKVVANEGEMQLDLLSMVLAQGEPFGSTSIYAQYRVFQLAKQNGIKVTLDGQGADELLAGYSGYPGHRLLSLIESKGLFSAHKFAKKWADSPGRSYSLAWKYLARLLLPDQLYSTIRKLFGRNFKPAWLNCDFLERNNVIFQERRAPIEDKNKGQRVKEALANSLMSRGLPALLRHGDRNSMAFSIESRVPFLTIPIADFLLSLPENYLISDEGVTKHIFREAMRGIVPDEHLDRKDKIGFATPEYVWLNNMANQIEEYLKSEGDIFFLNHQGIIDLLNSFRNGNCKDVSVIWRVFNYVVWYNYLIGRN